MKRRVWASKQKLEIVLEGLREDTVIATVCNRHQISQSMWFRWRDKLFVSHDKVFADGAFSRSEERLKGENRKLREIIGDLTVELKKTLD